MAFIGMLQIYDYFMQIVISTDSTLIIHCGHVFATGQCWWLHINNGQNT